MAGKLSKAGNKAKSASPYKRKAKSMGTVNDPFSGAVKRGYKK